MSKAKVQVQAVVIWVVIVAFVTSALAISLRPRRC
jgi:hypothetical protein